MLPYFTRPIVLNIISSKAYITSLSKRSLFLSVLFTTLLIFCFTLSNSTPWFLSKDQTYYLSRARNDTHLLSSNKFTHCQGRCATPDITNLDARQVFEACLDKGSLSEYYLTIIVVSRNDNYADFQYERFQNMLDSTFLMAKETETRIELLIVEWNPDKNKRLIQDAYR